MEELKIEIDNRPILSGKDLIGTVYLNIRSEIQAHYLKIVFTGIEKTRFSKQSASGKYYKEFIGNNKSVRSEAILKDWKNSIIEPGNYSFNFIFETPEGLPGTFKYDSNKSSGSIEYYLKAKLQGMFSNTILKDKQPVKIVQALEFQDSRRIEFSTQLLSCNCFNRGVCNTTIEFSQNVYNPGQTCEVTINIDLSKGKQNINSLQCILWVVCRMISNEKRVHYFRKCIYFYQHEIEIKCEDTLLTPKVINLNIPLSHSKRSLDECVVTFGKLLQCSYSLQIALEYGSVITDEPELQMPLYVALKEKEVEFNAQVNDSYVRLTREMQ